MHWFENLPWWAKIPLIVGGALMSAFSNSFPVGLQTAGLYTGITTASFGCIAVIWHWLNVWRERRGNPRVKLEPSHLIMFGALGAFLSSGVALAGFVWQQYRLPSADPPVSHISTSLGDRAATAPLNIYAPRSPSDADKEIRVVDSLYEILRREAGPQVLEGHEILNKWQDAFHAERSLVYFHSLLSFRNNVKNTNKKMWDIIQEFPQYCEDDLCVIVDPRNNQNVELAVDGFTNFLDHLKQMIDQEKINFYIRTKTASDVINPAFERVGNQLFLYGNWISKTENELVLRRKKLSEIADAAR